MAKVFFLARTKNQMWIANARQSFNMSPEYIIRDFVEPVNVLFIIKGFL